MEERVIRELARFFRTFSPIDAHKSCYNYVEKIEIILNKSHHDTIEMTAHEALKGEKPTRFWEKLVPLIQQPTKYKRTARLNKDKRGLTFEVGEQVLVKACNVANTAAGRVAKFLALYEHVHTDQHKHTKRKGPVPCDRSQALLYKQ